MKHTYKITGMTCGGCKSNVQKRLESVKDIETVTISLADGTAEIEMTTPIPLDKLKQVFEGTNFMIN